MYKSGANLLIIFYFHHVTDKSMEISMYEAETNLLMIFYFHQATDKSMEISCTRLEQTYRTYSAINRAIFTQIHTEFGKFEAAEGVSAYS